MPKRRVVPLSVWRKKGWIYHEDPRGWLVFAPEEQDVYSLEASCYPAPLGAECEVKTQKTLRSAGARNYLDRRGYKHCAPPEHFHSARQYE